MNSEFVLVGFLAKALKRGPRKKLGSAHRAVEVTDWHRLAFGMP